MDRRTKILDILATLILTSVLAWAVFSFLGKSIVFELLRSDQQTIRNSLSEIGPWASFVFVWLVVLEVLVAFIPGWIMYPIGAAIFGFWPGLGLIMFANFIGSSIAFWIGRRWGKKFLARFVSEKYVAHWHSYMNKHGSWSIFLLKINPLTSFDIWNYLAGASPLQFDRFTISNLLGILPLIALSVAAGEGGFRLTPWLLYVLAALTAGYAVWFFVKLRHISAQAKRHQ